MELFISKSWHNTSTFMVSTSHPSVGNILEEMFCVFAIVYSKITLVPTVGSK
jgi:hypothetical protein